MATTNSGIMTNALASPPAAVAPTVLGGRVRCVADVFETPAMAAADIIRLFPIPSNANLLSLEGFWDDLGTTLTADIGLYTSADVAADVDCYNDALVLGTAQATIINLRNHATLGGVAAVLPADLVWQNAGASSDPGGWYYVCLTCITSGTPAAGTFGYRATYVVD